MAEENRIVLQMPDGGNVRELALTARSTVIRPPRMWGKPGIGARLGRRSRAVERGHDVEKGRLISRADAAVD